MVTEKREPDWDPSAPAPGRLEGVRRFANSLDCYRGRDELADLHQARGLMQRLGGQSLTDFLGPDNGAQLLELRRGRAAVRAALGCSTLWTLSTGEDAEADGNQGGSYVAQMALEASVDGVTVRPVPGPAGRVLAPLFLELLIADRTGAASRLKVCANPDCQWVFWDTSRPGSARWCTMRVCGGQAKSRRYRERRAGASHD
jgi:CGNR zinc finger protein